MFIEKKTLIDEAKTSKNLPNVVWAIILVFIFMFAGDIMSLPLVLLVENPDLYIPNKEMMGLLITLISFGFISLVVFFRVTKIEKRKIASIGFGREKWLKKYSVGFLIGIIMMAVVVLVLYIFGYVAIDKKPVQPVGLSALPVILILLIGWIIQGGTEEILTRGWLMNVIGARYNIALGLIVSSIFFALLHLVNDNINYIAIINLCLIGIFYGLYVIKTNDLWAVCGMHSAWNFAQGNLFGFEVSGSNVTVGSLIDFKLVDNSNFITGGLFGPEAGLACTIILIISILILLLLDKKGYLKKVSL